MLKHNKVNFLTAFSLVILLLILSLSISISYVSNGIAFAGNDEVYLGGQPIGLNILSDGLIIIDYKPIITASGAVCPAKDSGLMIGDMIISINSTNIKTPSDLQKATNTNDNNFNLTVIRENKKLNFVISSVFDPLAGAKKLGLIVKNDISGIGTITYVDNNGNYCSLGHKICDPKLNNSTLYQNGKLYSAKILGVYKGNKDEAGALKGTFDKNSKEIGITTRNCEYGVYGKINDKKFISNTTKVKLGSKNDVKPGKAYIYTTIEGSTPQKYEIEIIKNYSQNSPQIKSMVIRVTDKRLLDTCGGIVQGMSGSPIIQNDKLVGAVTHVFLNDASIGYGVYIDWLF